MKDSIMRLDKIAIFYFSVIALVVTDGCLHLLLSNVSHAAVPFCLATMSCIPRSQFRPVSRLELGLTLGSLVALMVLTMVYEFFPHGALAGFIRAVICSPLFVVPYWMVMIWSICRRLLREKAS
jgi:hypothetical protein